MKQEKLLRYNHFDFYKPEKLLSAWEEVRTKGKMGGLDNISITDLEPKIDKVIDELTVLLEYNQYVPEPGKQIHIPKNKTELRSIVLCTITDKIVQTAVKLALEPIFETLFCDCSYAYRPGRGHRQAIEKVDDWISQKHQWFVHADIDNFYDSISQEMLLSFISATIADVRLLRLIQLWLAMGVVYEGEYLDHEFGIQQGGIISPLLSNIYLNSFDQMMTKKRYKLARYGDDLLVACGNYMEAELALNTILIFSGEICTCH